MDAFHANRCPWPERHRRRPRLPWRCVPHLPLHLHPDGKRLAIIAAADEDGALAQEYVALFFGFGDYLKRIAPAKP